MASHELKKANVDVESALIYAHLNNDTISTVRWEKLLVKVDDKASRNHELLLDCFDGTACAGDVVAVISPPGPGDSTLLKALANIPPCTTNISIEGEFLINCVEASSAVFRRASCYVESGDSLIGSLTVRQTLDFAAKLGLPRFVTEAERRRLVNSILLSFGLLDSADSIIGRPIRQGLSISEKRRVSIASQLINCPKILFLDEPTAGLDPVAGIEVMSYLRKIAKKYKIIVIASICQPSMETLDLFDTVVLLSQGKLCYSGSVSAISLYLRTVSLPVPTHLTPAEHMLNLVNADSISVRAEADKQPARLIDLWRDPSYRPHESRNLATAFDSTAHPLSLAPLHRRSRLHVAFTLFHRNWIKSNSDVVIHGDRIAVWLGSAIVIGAILAYFKCVQEYIDAHAIYLCYGVSFITCVALACIPAYLGDGSIYRTERANGLYGPSAFLLANFFIGLPWLCPIFAFVSVLDYWPINVRPHAFTLFAYLVWLFLDLMASESFVMFMASIIPVAVVAAVLAVLVNGVWMGIGLFLAHFTISDMVRKCWARLVGTLWLYGYNKDHLAVIYTVILLFILVLYKFWIRMRERS